ncbi:hypothetical protein CH278_25855 [Rhodococcus sp. 05-2254-5]|uniref:hypothetical protein n=1 Tax=unclassified Rhodococcus (in: high G+C Gram-positive bacteria) TaxID=192944 RepID=UPI000B9B8D5B|nr:MULTISPECIES: hypothetical protein [unclassified Rhodococcus (in: high G+C Gram-positive bacteria)]OZE26982.1 hypothetical protein CH278_25855 [Rhodococcus sp. 05-2254-5]OZE58324.1 hypothetical protein CH269_11015 [Rhodococcus sp. 05-2254-1]
MEMKKSFFVLWNGSDEGLDPDERRDMIDETTNGISYQGNWSFGRGYGNPLNGDRVYMLRTGKNRGVVASGELIADGAHPDEHWDEGGGTAMYVDVSWDVMLNDDDRLPVEEVQRALTDFKFPVQNSGRLVREPSASILAKLWSGHLDNLRRKNANPWLGGGGSGGGERVARRIPLEMNRIKEYYVESFASYRATRAESAMVHRFADTLKADGVDVSSFQMPLKNARRTLIADLFDNTNGVLYEAKASASREAVRMALGQLLDYRRHFETPPALSVLLPEPPVGDLIELLREHGIGCVHDSDEGFMYPTLPEGR